jgi:hypothetical protein
VLCGGRVRGPLEKWSEVLAAEITSLGAAQSLRAFPHLRRQLSAVVVGLLPAPIVGFPLLTLLHLGKSGARLLDDDMVVEPAIRAPSEAVERQIPVLLG